MAIGENDYRIKREPAKVGVHFNLSHKYKYNELYGNSLKG
jgi:hypothetical protein